MTRRFAGPEAHVGVLAPLRVAHLTDLHFGRVTPMTVQHEAVALVNAERPQLVALTGDFVGYGRDHLDQLQEALGRLQAPAVAVLGNHDHWAGADEVRRALERAGVLVLANQTSVLELSGQRLQVVGLDDAYTGHSDVAKATRGLSRDLPTLGLSHIAEEADALWAAGVPLVLSGHTHAGQITVARLHDLALGKLAGHRYVHGLYGDRSSRPASGAVYVGAGIGASMMPLRVGERARRELAVFELGTPEGRFREHHQAQAPHQGRARRRADPRTRWLGKQR